MIKIRQNVRMGMLAALAFLCLLTPRLAAAAQEVVNVQFDGVAGIVDLQLLRDGNKIVSAFAFETGRNTPWLVKTDQLTVAADGRIAGTITLTQTPDLLALVNARRGNKDAKAAPPLTDEVTLDVVPQGGKLEGTVKPATAKTALLGKADPVAARGRVYPQIPATESLITLLPFGVNAKPVDQSNWPIGGGLFLFMRVHGGRIERAKVDAWRDISFEVPAAVSQAIIQGNTLKGAIALSKADKSPVDGIVRYEGAIIGDYAVGLATWESGGTTEQTGFRARVSRHQPFPSLQVADRTWEPNGKPLEPDSVLAAKAKEESLQPIRPGEPGKQPFYSTVLIHRWALNERSKFSALYAPSIAFNEVPGAVKYRITAVPPKRREDGVGPWTGSLSCEVEKPWMPLTQLWKEAPDGQVRMGITATGLDAAGKELGQAEFPGKTYKYIGGDPLALQQWQIRPGNVKKDGLALSGSKNGVQVMKMATFAGPYWAPNRTAKEGALAAARWMRDAEEYMSYKNIHVWGPGTGVSPAPATFTRACVLIATLSDNPDERRDALALAERTAWMMYGSHRGGRFPNVYGGNVCLMVWFGLAYLDVYAVTKDPRFRDAALDLAKAFADAQDPEDGAWPGRDKKTGEKWWGGGVFGPSEARENGGEAVLWFLGRLRKELGVEDFVENEARANKWVQDYCLPEMFWQNVGHHSMEVVMLQDRVAPHALSYCTWQLDSAGAKDKDLKLVMEIARWCEERHVNWQRQPDPTKTLETRPSCWGWTRAAGTGIRNAGSLVYVWTRLWQETKDPLWKAKADALVQSILVSQDPVDGGFSKGFFRKSTDYTGGTAAFSYNDYDAVDAACRLVDYSRLTAGKP
jgi:hypothetical protein